MSEFNKELQEISTGDPVDLLIESQHSTVFCEDTKKLDDYKEDLLVGFECPYSWKIDKSDKNVISYVKKLLDLNEENVYLEHFQWYRFTLKLLLSYLLTNNREFEEAFELIDQCIKMLQEMEDEDCKEPLFAKIKSTLWHVTLVSNVYTLLVSSDENNADVKEILVKIKSVSDMTNVEKAGIYGIKTYMMLQYGLDGNMLGLESARMATDLDPEMAEWWFLVGKSMGRIRRVVGRMDCVEKEEIEALEKAVELEDRTSYLVFLAQTYRECALRSFKKYQSQVDLKTHDLGKYIDSLNQKALDIYIQAIEKQNNCPYTLSRCAAGLIRLPGHYKRTQLAEQVLKKSLELAPENAYANHVAGLLYYNHPYRDFNKALAYYEKAHEIGNYGASMDVLRLKSEMDSSFDPYEDLLKNVEKYKTEINQINLSCELGSYFLILKQDLIKAIEFYTTVIKKDRASLLKSNLVAFLSLDGPLNLLKIVLDEARLALQNADSLSKEDKSTIRKFMILASTVAPELIDAEPEKNQTKTILEKARLKMYKNKQSSLKFCKKVKSGSTSTHNTEKQQFEGMQERQYISNQLEKRSEQGEPRRDRAYSGRNIPKNNRDFFGTKGNNNAVQNNWRNDTFRSRPKDNGKNNHRQGNSTHNSDHEMLQNCSWRTEGRMNETTGEDESYRFPVKGARRES